MFNLSFKVMGKRDAIAITVSFFPVVITDVWLFERRLIRSGTPSKWRPEWMNG